MQPKFVHYDLKMIQPDFGSEIVDLIIELDILRSKQLGGSTHPQVFFQLKHIFQFLESLGSARIEGNNTTILEYVESKLEKEEQPSTTIEEIKNIEETQVFVEEIIGAAGRANIDWVFISEIHRKITHNLLRSGEGDNTPGVYRKGNLKINNSKHKPPDWLRVEDYMDELLKFIKEDHSPKYDLLKIAIAHHRFAWIHPFGI